MVKLVASDLDGTLLRSDGSISPRTLVALQRLTAQGVHFVAVTARPLCMVQRLAGLHGLTGLAICSNGALTVDLASGNVIAHEALGAQAAGGVVAALRRGAPGVSYALERLSFFAEERGFYTEVRRHYPGYPFAPEVVDDVLALCAEPCTALLALHPHLESETLAEVAREAPGVSVTFSGGRFVEVAALGATKGAALARLARNLGIDSNEVLAFGDMPNDLSMLAWAERSVAMGNAHPAVLSAATDVTASNDEDGVALVLEDLLAMRYARGYGA